jgi:hypothetical protein
LNLIGIDELIIVDDGNQYINGRYLYGGIPHFPMLTKVYYIIKNLIVDQKHGEIILQYWWN